MKSDERIPSNVIESHLRDISFVAHETVSACTDAINDAAAALVRVFQEGGKLRICGNGGSAAHAGHLAAELVSSFRRGLGRAGLPAISLPDHVATMTAFVNDFGPEGAFARQVQAFGATGDALLAISTSGQSQNVIEGAKVAAEIGMQVIALTGEGHSELSSIADTAIRIPSRDTQVLQAIHIAVAHIICEQVDSAFGASSC